MPAARSSATERASPLGCLGNAIAAFQIERDIAIVADQVHGQALRLAARAG